MTDKVELIDGILCGVGLALIGASSLYIMVMSILWAVNQHPILGAVAVFTYGCVIFSIGAFEPRDIPDDPYP